LAGITGQIESLRNHISTDRSNSDQILPAGISLIAERIQAAGKASGLMAGKAGDAFVAGRSGVALPLFCNILVWSVAHHGDYLIQMLICLLGATCSLSRLGEAA
jgi:hypothetical protein